MELSAFLPWLSTVGAALVAYWLIKEIPRLARLGPKAKRRLAYAMSAGIAILAYLAMMGMHYAPIPITPRSWIEVLFAVGTGAFGLSQMIHGERQLPVDALPELARKL